MAPHQRCPWPAFGNACSPTTSQSSMPMQVGSGREALGAIVPSLVRGLACPSTEVQQSALAMCCAFIPPLFSGKPSSIARHAVQMHGRREPHRVSPFPASARQDLFYRCTPHLCAMLVSLCAWMCAAELSGSAPAVAVDTLHRTFGACPDTKLRCDWCMEGTQKWLIRCLTSDIF